MDEEMMQYLRGQVVNNAPDPVSGDVLGMLAGQGVQSAAGAGELPESYGPATGDGRACGNCRFFMDGWCTSFDAPVEADAVCDTWEPSGGVV